VSPSAVAVRDERPQVAAVARRFESRNIRRPQ
jgi:hypothetical protein